MATADDLPEAAATDPTPSETGLSEAQLGAVIGIAASFVDGALYAVAYPLPFLTAAAVTLLGLGALLGDRRAALDTAGDGPTDRKTTHQ